MPELAVIEKLQPCLLDRLTDDEPKNSQESRSQRVISIQRYRNGVLRDLQWLFGSSAHLAQEGNSPIHLKEYPEAYRSVLNFGTRHLFGKTTLSTYDLERELMEALYVFEPRIISNSLKVRARISGHVVALDVEGDLWASPLPAHLQIKTVLDIEGGYCTLGS